MAGRQARGNMTLHMDINNAEVGYKLRTLQRQIHQVSHAWKAQSHTLWIAGQREEALRAKMDGINKEADLEKKFIDRANKSLEASNRAKEQGNKKYQRLHVDRDSAIQQLNEYNNQIQHTKNLLTLHNDELLKSSRIAKSNVEVGRAKVKELQAEGHESEANVQRMRNYRTHLEGLRNEYQAVANTIQRARTKHLTDPIKFPEFRQRVAQLHQLGAEISQTTSKQKDFDSELTTSKQYNKAYNETTNKLVASLKQMKQSAQANRIEYNRLKNNQASEARALDREADKAERVANASGKNSVAYQKEYGRLTALRTTYQEHINQIMTLGNTYSRMSSRVANNIDNQRLKIRRLNLASHSELITAHSLTNASIALGSGFIYGAHQAMQLENEFNKVRNLLNTSGESYRQSTDEINKMGKATERYSIQYGVSQDEISKGYEELVRRGYSGNQALASQKSYLQGAIASGDKYSDVMDTAASTLEAFGLRSNKAGKMISNTKMVVNQLAYSADATATDMRGIGEGMKFVGATAHSANQSVAETSSALGVLSNNGQDATNAGFGLRKVLNSFISANDTKKWKKILPKMGLSAKDFQDAQGHFKNLSTMMSILNSHMHGMSQAKKTDIFHQLFGATGQESALILARNTGNLFKLNGQVAKSQKQANGQGYAARIARKNMNSTENQMNRLKMAGQDLAKDYAQGLNPAFKRLADASLIVAQGIGDLPKPIKNVVAMGTAAIPVIAGVNYGLSSLHKIHALSIQTSLRMMGIGKSEQEALKAKINTTNAVKEANDQNNQSITNSIRLYRQKQRAEQDDSTSLDHDTGATKANSDAQKANINNLKDEDLSRMRYVSESQIHPHLSKWDNATGGTIGTGMERTAFKRYGAAGAGMGALIGGSEMLNGNVKGGAEDAVGTTGGTALGGVIAGPMGAAIGGTAGPMIAKIIGDRVIPKINHPYHVGNNERATTAEDRSNIKQLNYDLKHINESTQNFVRNEAGLTNKATDQFVAAGGKVTKSLRQTANDIYDTAQKYGNAQLKGEDSTLHQALNNHRITNSQYIEGTKHLKSSESSVLSNIRSDENKAITDTHLTTKQRERLLSSANSYEMKLTSTSGSKQNHLLSDLNRRTRSLNTKSYASILSQASSNYKSTSKNASTHYKNEMSSAKAQYSAMEKAGLINSKSASKSMKNLGSIYGSQRKDTVGKAKDTSNKVSTAASQMADNTTKKHYKTSQSVSVTNSKDASENTSVAKSNSKTWSAMESAGGKYINEAFANLVNDAQNAVNAGKRLTKNHPVVSGGMRGALDVVKAGWNQTIFGSLLPAKHFATGTSDTNISHVMVDDPLMKRMSNHANGSYDTAALHFANGILPGLQRNENAVINDGGGRELVKLPNGQFVLPSGHNIHTYLPKGTSVFNALQTRKLLGLINQPMIHHALGTVSSVDRSKNVHLSNSGLKKTERATKKSMKNIHELMTNGYKKSGKDSKKLLDRFHDKSNDIWDDTRKTTKHHVNKLHDDTISRYSDLKDTVNSIEKASNLMTDNYLDTTINYFKHHFSMISPISRKSMQSGVLNINSGISAIDKVLSQFGGNSHVLNTVHYATGTSRPPLDKQLAVLNDATSGPTQEAVVSTNGRVRIPQGRNILTTLDPGDKVLNGSDTLRALRTGLIPHYSQGLKSTKALKKLASHYTKQPTSFTDGTFNKFAQVIGDTLTKDITYEPKIGIQPSANAWSRAMWRYISNLIDGGSSSQLLNKAEQLGRAARGYSENLGKRMGPNYYDCASLVWTALKDLGIHINGGTTVGPIMRAFSSNRVSRKDARPGDLVGSNDHIGLVADKGAHHYYSAQDPRDGIGMEPLVESAFPDGWFYIERVPQLANHHINNDRLTSLVRKQLGNKSSKWIKSHLNDSIGSSVSNPTGDSITRWKPVINRVLSNLHLSTNNNNIQRVLRQIGTESGGNPYAVGGTDGLSDGRAMGLMQVKPGTFAANAPRGGKWSNGYDSIYAGLKYAIHRYGGLGVLGNGHGYANGGLTTTEKLAHISEGNRPEMILPLTNKSRAIELMMKSLQYMFGLNQNVSGNTTGKSTSNVDHELERKLIRSNQQKDHEINRLTDTTNRILNKMTILINTVKDKPVISDVDIYTANRKQSLKNLRLRNLNRGSF